MSKPRSPRAFLSLVDELVDTPLVPEEDRQVQKLIIQKRGVYSLLRVATGLMEGISGACGCTAPTI